MLPVSDELKNKLIKLNHTLKENFPMEAFDRVSLRKELERVGSFYRINNWDKKELQKWIQDKSIVGIDGSVNSTKGTPTRAFSVFQALALGTKGEEKWAADIYTPLLDKEEDLDEGQAAREAKKRGSLLSNLEMKLTLEIIHEWDARGILLDGSLLHFFIDSPELWEEVRENALRKGVYLVGASEEIGTSRLVKEIYPAYTTWTDRDLLYGVLEIGEAFEWEEWSPSASNMWRMAFRPSMSPDPIGVDGLIEQRAERFRLLQLISSLSPKQGRGIPFWLDIVDNQVRVTDALVQTLIEQYIDPDLRHRLFDPKRKQRII